MAIVTFNIFSSAASCGWIEMLEPRKKKKKKEVKTIYLFKNGVVVTHRQNDVTLEMIEKKKRRRVKYFIGL